MTIARLDGTWLRCGACGHKLFKVTGGAEALPEIEIKCHSCKALNYTSANAQNGSRMACNHKPIGIIGHEVKMA